MPTSIEPERKTLDTVYYYDPDQQVNTFDSWELSIWNCPSCGERLAAYYVDVCGHNSRDNDPVSCPKCKDDSVRIRSVTYPQPKPVEELLVELANGAIAAEYADKKLISPDEM